MQISTPPQTDQMICILRPSVAQYVFSFFPHSRPTHTRQFLHFSFISTQLNMHTILFEWTWKRTTRGPHDHISWQGAVSENVLWIMEYGPS